MTYYAFQNPTPFSLDSFTTKQHPSFSSGPFSSSRTATTRARPNHFVCQQASSSSTSSSKKGTKTTSIRFVNIPHSIKAPLETETAVGTRLLDVSDTTDLYIPRGCRSGICGTCTVDIDGAPTHACQYQVRGGEEVDCWRMLEGNNDKKKDPMARFEGVEQGLISKEDMTFTGGVFGGNTPGMGTNNKVAVCENCQGVGEVWCTSCGGQGVEWNNGNIDCFVCAGRRRICCSFCQGAGYSSLRPWA